MPVPSTQDIRRALLEILEDGHPRSMTAKGWMTLAEKHLGITLSMHMQESKEFRSRIREALKYLTEENMISKPSWNTYMITKKGQSVLECRSGTADDNNLTEEQPDLQQEAEIIQPPEEDRTLPDDLDTIGDDTEGAETAETTENTPDEGFDALPDDLVLTGHEKLTDELELTSDDADTADTSQSPDEESDVCLDDLDLASDDAEILDTADTPETPGQKLDALPDDLDLSSDNVETLDTAGTKPELPDTKLDTLPDDLDAASGEKTEAIDITDTPDEELDTLSDKLNLTSDDAETADTPETQCQKLDALPDELDLIVDDAEGADTLDTPDPKLDALPDSLGLTCDDSDITDTIDVSDPKTDTLPDDLDLASDEAEGADTPQSPDDELDALPDDLDLAGDDSEAIDSAEITTLQTSDPKLDVLPDISATGDSAEGADTPDIPEPNFDALPDSLDLSSDDSETLDTAETTDPKTDALPDELNLAGDEAEGAYTPQTPDPKLDTFPDELDLTSDDSEASDDDATPEESSAPEFSDTQPEISDSFTESPDIQDSQQNTDSDTDTLISIDEVDPDMPKDDLPAEDFSSAVNQALNIEDVFERHNSELADKVLMRAAGLTPEMFAVFVTDLLSKMGYNAFQTARYTSESEGSSMIQGVILDPKAKSPIYIHADKLSPGRTVGRSDMHDFADELAEKGGTGIFATTGEFSEQAGIYAQDERIMLIDGKKLASLMLAHNFCVNVAKIFEVKELDEDSFSEYE